MVNIEARICKLTYEQIELPAKLLDYFLWSNTSNIKQILDWPKKYSARPPAFRRSTFECVM